MEGTVSSAAHCTLTMSVLGLVQPTQFLTPGLTHRRCVCYCPLHPHTTHRNLTGGKQAQDAAVQKRAYSRLDPEAPRLVLPSELLDVLHSGGPEQQRDGCAILVEVTPPVPQEGEVLHLTGLQRCTARYKAVCSENSRPLAEDVGASVASCTGQKDKRWLREHTVER